MDVLRKILDTNPFPVIKKHESGIDALVERVVPMHKGLTKPVVPMHEGDKKYSDVLVSPFVETYAHALLRPWSAKKGARNARRAKIWFENAARLLMEEYPELKGMSWFGACFAHFLDQARKKGVIVTVPPGAAPREVEGFTVVQAEPFTEMLASPGFCPPFHMAIMRTHGWCASNPPPRQTHQIAWERAVKGQVPFEYKKPEKTRG